MYGVTDAHRQFAIQNVDPCVLVLHAGDLYGTSVDRDKLIVLNGSTSETSHAKVTSDPILSLEADP